MRRWCVASSNFWHAYSDLYNSVCDDLTTDTDAYRKERAFCMFKAAIAFLELLTQQPVHAAPQELVRSRTSS